PTVRSIVDADNKVEADEEGNVRFTLKPHKVFLFKEETEERVYFEIPAKKEEVAEEEAEKPAKKTTAKKTSTAKKTTAAKKTSTAKKSTTTTKKTTTAKKPAATKKATAKDE
ncbi:MAG: hypothetical protein K2M64_00670, partial [Clostridia bacterium]|nr:hypothetical protein [Clostridia bacterium]